MSWSCKGIAAFFGIIVSVVFLPLQAAQAQRPAWRQATDGELAALLPARAQVVKEHIETELRTASGIVDRRGRFIAGVVLLTAGYLLMGYPVWFGGSALAATIGNDVTASTRDFVVLCTAIVPRCRETMP